ncbi:MAG: ATP-binding protein, partial [Myxococcota bacterium]
MRRPNPTLRPSAPGAWIPASAMVEGKIWLTWLVRLRWLALFAQAVTLAFMFKLLDGLLPIAVWGATMGVLVLTNLWSTGRLALNDDIDTGSVLFHLTIDVAALTAFFAVADGPDNPFTNLYLVHVAMGAVMLPPRMSALLALTVLLGYSGVFAAHLPLHYEEHSLPSGVLVRLGQWMSFAITSLSVSVFVVGLAGSLRRNRQELLDARDRTARTDRLRSVGTLAAGAAHELNTPLSTMALRLRRVRRRHGDPATEADVDAIEDQLDRCISIVERLLIGAGDPAASGLVRRPLAGMVAEAVRLWSRGATVGVEVTDRSDGIEVELPDVAFEQALINLLENAREAQEAAGTTDPLALAVSAGDGCGVIELADRGIGLPEKSDQMGEPFFTTKASGTGLGVFVARAVADGVGGGLQYLPRDSGGVVARWWFPEARRKDTGIPVPRVDTPPGAPVLPDPGAAPP